MLDKLPNHLLKKIMFNVMEAELFLEDVKVSNLYFPANLSSLFKTNKQISAVVKSEFWDHTTGFKKHQENQLQIAKLKKELVDQLVQYQRERNQSFIKTSIFSDKTRDDHVTNLIKYIEQNALKTKKEYSDLKAYINKEKDYAKENNGKEYRKILDKMLDLMFFSYLRFLSAGSHQSEQLPSSFMNKNKNYF